MHRLTDKKERKGRLTWSVAMSESLPLSRTLYPGADAGVVTPLWSVRTVKQSEPCHSIVYQPAVVSLSRKHQQGN